MHFFQLCTAPHACILICPFPFAVGIKRGCNLFYILGTPLIFNPSVQLVQDDIGEQWTDNSSLGSTLCTLDNLSIRQNYLAVEDL